MSEKGHFLFIITGIGSNLNVTGERMDNMWHLYTFLQGEINDMESHVFTQIHLKHNHEPTKEKAVDKIIYIMLL